MENSLSRSSLVHPSTLRENPTIFLSPFPLLFSFLVLPLALACSKNDVPPAADPAAITGKTVPSLAGAGFDAVVEIPTKSMDVDGWYLPNAKLKPVTELKDLASVKAEYMEDGYLVTSAEALPDGWVITVQEDEYANKEIISQREFGGRTLLCESSGSTSTNPGENSQEYHDFGRATCLQMRAKGSNILVPFVFADGDKTFISGDLGLRITLVSGATDKSADDVFSNKSKKPVDNTTHTNGFALTYSRGAEHGTFVRTKIGEQDVTCESSEYVDAPLATAQAMMAVCLSLRAP